VVEEEQTGALMVVQEDLVAVVLAQEVQEQGEPLTLEVEVALALAVAQILVEDLEVQVLLLFVIHFHKQ
jgi:hypothetical protein